MKSTYNAIVRIISSTLGIDMSQISLTTNLFDDLDIDSLTILGIVNLIEEEWQIKLNEHPELLDEMETVETLVCYLDSMNTMGNN